MSDEYIEDWGEEKDESGVIVEREDGGISEDTDANKDEWEDQLKQWNKGNKSYDCGDEDIKDIIRRIIDSGGCDKKDEDSIRRYVLEKLQEQRRRSGLPIRLRVTI